MSYGVEYTRVGINITDAHELKQIIFDNAIHRLVHGIDWSDFPSVDSRREELADELLDLFFSIPSSIPETPYLGYFVYDLDVPTNAIKARNYDERLKLIRGQQVLVLHGEIEAFYANRFRDILIMLGFHYLLSKAGVEEDKILEVKAAMISTNEMLAKTEKGAI